MIVISNSSPLLALSQVQRLDILKTLFGRIYIPDSVYRETVFECNVPVQKEGIEKATDDFIEVVTPSIHHPFSRKLGKGEQGVLNLAIEKRAQILLMIKKLEMRRRNWDLPHDGHNQTSGTSKSHWLNCDVDARTL
jgi:predicted nucleic acid-binding protein